MRALSPASSHPERNLDGGAASIGQIEPDFDSANVRRTKSDKSLTVTTMRGAGAERG